MAAKPTNIKFMKRGAGAVHIITTKREDLKTSKCPQVKKGHEDSVWKGKGISPEAALALKGCSKCNTHDMAEVERRARMTPAEKRAESRAKAAETRDHLSKSKPKQKAKGRRKPAGQRVDVNEKMKANCDEHAEFAKKHGWKPKVINSDTNEWRVEAKRDGELLRIIWRDGRTIHSRVTLESGVEVRLRNSANWRKHASGESKIAKDYVPRQVGKKAAKREVIDDDVAAVNKLPFDPVDDDDDTIIESLVGKRITWRNSVTKSLMNAKVPTRSRNVRITVHPKSERRIVSFYESQGFHKDHGEMLGGERSVYLDKILKVRA